MTTEFGEAGARPTPVPWMAPKVPVDHWLAVDNALRMALSASLRLDTADEQGYMALTDHVGLLRVPAARQEHLYALLADINEELELVPGLTLHGAPCFAVLDQGPDEVDTLLDQSSLGAPNAKAIQALTPDAVIDAIEDRVAADRSRALYERPPGEEPWVFTAEQKTGLDALAGAIANANPEEVPGPEPRSTDEPHRTQTLDQAVVLSANQVAQLRLTSNKGFTLLTGAPQADGDPLCIVSVPWPLWADLVVQLHDIGMTVEPSHGRLPGGTHLWVAVVDEDKDER